MNSTFSRASLWTLLAVTGLLYATVGHAQLRVPQGAGPSTPPAASAPSGSGVRGDFIVAIVNQSPITNSDVQRFIARLAAQVQGRGESLPPWEQLIQQVLEDLIDERVQIDHAREIGLRVDDALVNRAMQGIATQNGLTVTQLESEIRTQGLDVAGFRARLRDDLLLQRVREREVEQRIRVTDVDVDAFLGNQAQQQPGQVVYDLSQILVAVPEAASAQERARLREKAGALRERAQKGEAFDALARAHSDAPDRANGGALGPRRGDRLPELFLKAASRLAVGEISPLLESGAGFHVLRLNDRNDTASSVVPQTRARHILLRAAADDSENQQIGRLREFKRRIEAGQATFEQLAQDHSQDASAGRGGDLGWVVPGQFVPEFEQTMDRLAPGEIAEPVVSRFGVHLIQVLERREVELTQSQRREVARNMLREQRFDATYDDWARELRDRAYIELRELPQ